MSKNVNRKFTLDLDISTKNAEAKVKAMAGDIKTLLADLGGGKNNKIGVFKELVDYLNQVDEQIARFKKKHGDGLFEQIFGGLDASLRNEVEKLFGTTKEQISQVEALRAKILDAKKNGISDDEVRTLEDSLRGLYSSIGMEGKAKLTGKGKIATRLDNLEKSLNNFALVWEDVNNKVSQGFAFGGHGGNAGNSSISDIEKVIKDTEKKMETLRDTQKELDKMRASYKGFVDDEGLFGDDISSIDRTVESVRDLVAAYEVAIKKRAAFEADGDSSSKAYYENELKLAKLALQARDFVDYNEDEDLDDKLDIEEFNGKPLHDYLDHMSEMYENILDEIVGTIKTVNDSLRSELDALNRSKSELADRSKQQDPVAQAKQRVREINELKSEIDKKIGDKSLNDEALGSYIQKVGELSSGFRDLAQSAGLPEDEIKGLEGTLESLGRQLTETLDRILKNKGKNPIDVLFDESNGALKDKIRNLAKFDKEYKMMLGTTSKMTAFDNTNPSDIQREYILEAFREYQKISSSKEQKGLPEVAKMQQLLRIISQASIDKANTEDYQKIYGIDGDELKAFVKLVDKKEKDKISNRLSHQSYDLMKEARSQLINALREENEEVADLIMKSAPEWNKFLAGKDDYFGEPTNIIATMFRTLESKAAKKAEEQKNFNELKTQFDNSIKDFTDTGIIDVTGNEQEAYNAVLDGIRNKTIKTVDECKAKFAELAKLDYEELAKKNEELISQAREQGAPIGGVSDKISQDVNESKKDLKELQRIKDECVSIINSLGSSKKPKINISDKNDAAVLSKSLKNMQQAFATWATSKNGTEEQIEAYGRLIDAAKKYQSVVGFIKKSGSQQAKELLYNKEVVGASRDADAFLGSLDAKQKKAAKTYFEKLLGATDQDISATLTGNKATDNIAQTGDAAKKAAPKVKTLTDEFNEYIASIKNAGNIEWGDNIKAAYKTVFDGIKKNTFTTVEECKAKFRELANITEVIRGAGGADGGSGIGSGSKGASSGSGTGSGGTNSGKGIGQDGRTSDSIDTSALQQTISTEAGKIVTKLNDTLKVEIVKNSSNTNIQKETSSQQGSSENIQPTSVQIAIQRLHELQTDPYDIKDEDEVNRIYQKRLAIIEQIGEEKLKAYNIEEYQDAIDTNKVYEDRILSIRESKDDRVYDQLDENYYYDGERLSSSQELETLLETRLALLEKISNKESDSYREQLLENQAIQDRIVLMKELEPLYRNGKISEDDLEELVIERGTIKERASMLDSIQGDISRDASDESSWDDLLEEAQLYLDTYEKILITTASGKKLELGPEMSMEDYRAFLRMNVERAKSIEFIRKQTESQENLNAETKQSDASKILETASALKKQALSYDTLTTALETYIDANRVRLGEMAETELSSQMETVMGNLFGRFRVGTVDDWYKLANGNLSIEDFIVKIKPEFDEQLLKENKRVLGNQFEDYLKKINIDPFDETFDSIFDEIDNGTLTTLDQCVSKFKELKIATDSVKTTENVTSANSSEIQNLEALQQKLIEVRNAVDAKTRAFEEEYVTVDAAVESEMAQLNALLDLLKQIITQVGILNDGFSNTGKNVIASGGNITVTHATEKEYALESTLNQTNTILNSISDKLTQKNDFSDLIEPLKTAAAELKNVADGIIQHQKAQKSNTSAAMARISDPKKHQMIVDVASNSIGDLGSDVQIKGLRALANGIVSVEGAFKNVNDEWEGFTVKVNESNKAVDLAINKQSAFAKALSKVKIVDERADDNPHKISASETEKRAFLHAMGYADQGEDVTIRYQDNERYTVALRKNIGALQKEVFQTFDDSIADFDERTTVTISTKTQAALKNTNKFITENMKLLGDNQAITEYTQAYADLLQITNEFQTTDDLSDSAIEKWNKQIDLVNNLGTAITNLIKIEQNRDPEKEAKKADAAVFSKMKEKKKNIGKYQIKLAGLDEKSETDIPVIEEIKNTLGVLNNEYDALENQLKKPLSTEQLKELSEIAEKTADDIRLARAEMKGSIAAKNKKDIKKADDDAAKRSQNEINNAFSKMEKKKKAIGALEVAMAKLDKGLEKDVPKIEKIANILERLKQEYNELEGSFGEFLSSEQVGKLRAIEQDAADKIGLEKAEKEGSDAEKEKEAAFKRLLEISKKMGEIDVEIAGLDDDNDIERISSLTDSLRKLEEEYNSLYETFKKGFSKDQIDSLDKRFTDNIFVVSEARRKRNEAKRKKEEALARKANTDELFELDRGEKLSQFDLDIAKLRAKGEIDPKHDVDKARKEIEDAADKTQLDKAIKAWRTLKNEIEQARIEAEKLNKETSNAFTKKSLQAYSKDADAMMKGLDFGINDKGLKTNQQEILDKYREILEIIDKAKKANRELTQEEETNLRGKIDDLKGKTKSYTDDINAKKEKEVAKKKEDDEKQEAQKKFKDKYDKEIDSFDKYTKSLQNADYLTTELKTKIEDLEKKLLDVKTSADLSAWQEEFKNLSHEIDVAKNKWVGVKNADKEGYKKQADDAIKGLGFDKSDSNLNDEQRKISQAYDNVIAAVKEYESNVKSGNKAEVSGIREAVKALKEKTDAYRKANNIANVNTKNFGEKAIRHEDTRYERLNSIATTADNGYSDSPKFLKKFNEYKAKYAELVNLQKQFANSDSLTNEQVAQWNKLKDTVANMGKELEQAWQASKKLISSYATTQIEPLEKDFVDNATNRRIALTDFAKGLHNISSASIVFDKNYTRCTYVVENSDGTFTQMTARLDNFSHKIIETAGSTKAAESAFSSFFGELKRKASNIIAYLISITGIEEVFQAIRQGIQYVIEIDTALTELKKVTNATSAEYDAFLQSMSKTSSVIGSTVSDLTTMAAEWARLGYSMEEAGKLAESTAILLNVSEFQDATTASEALISTMQAFKYVADDSQHVVDILNEVGNNYAISSDGLAIALQDSASALMEGGVNLEQAVALVASANKVIQDPNSVGSALRTISLRLRGTSVEILEEMGEETDGVVESTSKLQEQLKALTGVDILTDAGGYKDVYTILKEIGAVWQDLDELDKAAALELMAGKNRANTLSAILNNTKDLENAYESALQAEGSALRENEKYLDSIQGRITIFTSTLQTMWMNAINSDFVKFVVDLGTSLLKLVDTIGMLPTAIGAFVGFNAIKSIFKVDDFQTVIGIIKEYIKDGDVLTSEGQGKVASTIRDFTEGRLRTSSLVQYAMTLKLVTKEQVANMTTTELLGISFKALGLKIKEATIAMAKFLFTTPAGWAILATTAIVGLTVAISSSIKTHEDYLDILNEESEVFRNIQSELKSVSDELENARSRMEELQAKGTLSFVEQEELNRLKEQTAELERQEKILQAQEQRAKKRQVEAALNAIKTDNNLKTTTNIAVSPYAASYQQNNVNTLGTPYAAALQTADKQNNVLGTNQYEFNLNALKEAKEDLENARIELSETTYDYESEEYQALEKKVEGAQLRVDKYNQAIDSMNDEWKTKYGEVGYIEDATEEWQKQWNEKYREHQDYVNQQGLLNNTVNQIDVLDDVFGRTGTDVAKEFKSKFEEAVKNGKDPAQIIEGLISSGNYDTLLNDVKNKFGITADTIKGYFDQVGKTVLIEEATASAVKSYSVIAEDVAAYNEVLMQTSEIVTDNTLVTQEYKDAILALGVKEDELNDCFDENNKLIVKNASALRKLVSQARKEKQATITVAKAQAQLQYQKLIDQMSRSVLTSIAQGSAYDFVANAVRDNTSAMKDQLDALEQTIQQYSLLEISLTDAANAFSEYEKAKERDAQISYDDSFLEMLKTIDEGLLKNETGTEAFEYAVKAIVPEEFWKDIDDVDKKIKSIHDYIDGNPVFSKLFNVDKESGELDISADNVREFVKMGLSEDVGVFAGDSSGDFDLSDNVNGIEDVAKAYGITEAAALALLTALEKVDAKWGDILTQVMMTPFDRKVYNTTKEIAEANDELANAQDKLAKGEMTLEDYNKIAEEYKKKTSEANQNLDAYTKQAKDRLLGSDNGTEDKSDDIPGFIELNKQVAEAQEKITESTEGLAEAQEKYNKAKNSGASEEELKNYQEDIEEATAEVNNHTEAWAKLVQKRGEYPSEYEISLVIADIDKEIQAVGNKFDSAIEKNFDLDKNGYYVIKTGVDITALEKSYPGITEYIKLCNTKTEIQAFADTTSAEEDANKLKETVDNVIEAIEENLITLDLDEEAVNNIVEEVNKILSGIISNLGVTISASLPSWLKSVLNWMGFDTSNTKQTSVEPSKPRASKPKSHANTRQNTVHALGSANTGLKANEHNAVMGELGPELVCDPIKGIYYTVGDNGTEMVNLPKGAIIYNHKQTEELLKHGYTSRGKYTGGLSFAQGNAHGNLGVPSHHPNTKDKTSFEDGSGVNTRWDAAASALSSAADKISDAADDFRETFDWIEVRLEELDEALSLLSAQLENASNYSAQNNIIDSIIGVNQNKMENLAAGIAEYAEYASKLLNEVPSQFREAAQNGAIAITDFAGEANEATVEAINNYREWAQKVADLKQQLEEVKTEIKDLARQKFDNIYEAGNVRATIENSQTEKLQNAVDLIEESGRIATEEYYKAMMENSDMTIKYLTDTRDEMQKVFNEAVEAGIIVRGSNEWYEMVDELYQIDAEIDGATKELEEFQNAINDIYWDNFDQLINRLDYLKDETQNLIDLMDDVDLVDDNGDWTDEGLASLGLYAQQMEIAEYQSKQYAEAIDDLTADFEAGLYSENEYVEKLAELKDAQYDSIAAYEDAKEAIVDLNKTRVDAIKEGIEEEIDAYEELINKKKEALDAEKDLYGFQKGVAEQQKTIAEIERQLAALANDNSLSAAAKRKQLEAELAEAQYELQETYYDRSVEDKQNALDKELEDFKAEKEAEIEAWDEYLENIELVVAESLGIIQENASGIYDTLMEKANEYDLTISEAITAPWQDGAFAVSDYQEQFDTAMSSTMNQLEALKNKWQEIIDKMLEASKAEISGIHNENNNYESAEEKKQEQTQTPSTPPAENNKPKEEKKIAVGGKINAAGAKIYSSIGSKGQNQYYGKDPVYVVLEEKNGYLKVRHHSAKSGVTGWFKKSDVKAYAKGSIGVDKDQWSLLDELGEELQLVPGKNGRLEYVKKGTGIIPANLTERLMDLAMNPQEMLDRNRPSVNVSPSIVTNTIEVNMNIAEVVHIDKVDNDTLPDLTKAVRKEMDSYMGKINNAIKSKVR